MSAVSWEDVIYQYDGSFDGFLCCVHDSYIYKEFPIAFEGDEESCVLSLYSVRTVLTQTEHARRVYRSIVKHSPQAAELLRRAFLTCMPEKEEHLYAFVRKLFREGPAFLRNQADEVYAPVVKALRHMSGELEKLRGFVRFSDYSGVLGAEIEPKNRVLPLLRRHLPTSPSSSTTARTARCCSIRRGAHASPASTRSSWNSPVRRRSITARSGSVFSRRSPSASAKIPAARTPSCPSATAAR